MSTDPLAGKSVFVTGGARRIGRAIALTLAQAGADVAISYRTSQAEAAQTAAEIAALGRRAARRPVRCPLRTLRPRRRRASHRRIRPPRHPRQQRCRLCLRSARKPDPRPVGRRLRNQRPRPVSRCARSPASSPRRAGPHHQHGFSRWASSPGPATPTTAPQRPLCTCSRKPWPRPSRPMSA